MGNGGIARMSVSAIGGTERTSSAARSGITNTTLETTRNDVALTRSLWPALIVCLRAITARRRFESTVSVTQ
jgi:hypothetical protein